MTSPVTAIEATRSLLGARFRWKHPLYLVHALTARCNARCGFCAWSPEFYDPRQQLPTEDILRLYSDARDSGFLGLSLWGGEPLLHPDFERVVQHAHDLGLITNLITNGFLLERKLDAVVRWADRVCISLDHPSDKHDELRKIPGLFAKIVGATRALRSRAPDKTILFICTLQKDNVEPETLEQLAKLMAELGVLGIFNGLREEAATDKVDPRLDAYAPSQSQLAVAFATLQALKRKGFPIMNSHTHMRMMAAGPPQYHCHWPKFMLPIEANGDVVDCMHWGTRPIGSLKQARLPELLKRPRLAELAGKAGEGCHKCVSIHRVEISEVCSGNLEPVRSWTMLGKSPSSKRLPLVG
ncbi:MAG: radical SAM protein [Polyangiaceae bacterium]